MRYAAVPDLATSRTEAPRGAPSAVRPLATSGNQALLRRLQAKLTIGAVDDPLEHEADAVAAQVMRMPQPGMVASSPPQISRKCAACEEDAKLQTKPAGKVLEGDAPASVDEALQSPGQPLDTAVLGFFEPRFGADFSGVRVRSGGRAAASAQEVGAQAYAVGKDLVFAPGAYAPGSNSGRALIAHELAHVVQQRGPTLRRRVVGVTCPANTAGAPADPRHDLETADTTAIALATAMAKSLATDSATVAGGIPPAPSATLTSYRNRFGFPPASGSGFLNRLTGTVRPSREIALSEELAIVSQRFAASARLMTQGLSYQCPGSAPLTLVGCSAGTCADGDAFSCPGNSLVGLCSTFWTNYDDTARAQVLIHESLHIQFGDIQDRATRGSGRNFNIAGCYEAMIADGTGADSHVSCPAVPAP